MAPGTGVVRRTLEPCQPVCASEGLIKLPTDSRSAHQQPTMKKTTEKQAKPLYRQKLAPLKVSGKRKKPLPKGRMSLRDSDSDQDGEAGATDGLPRTTIDLFCGAGGITEGFRREGFHCLYANDINPSAVETFRANHPETRAETKPIEHVDAAALRRSLKLKQGDLDVLVGGPPCQGFSINAPERFLEDPRNSLFKHYIRFLDEFKPKMLLIENVPGMLSLGGGVIFEQIIRELEARGYRTRTRVLFSAHYGVPQERWRTIILGSRVSEVPEHPAPTHYAHARANFKGGKTLTFRPTPLEQYVLKAAVTVGDALSDLPKLKMGEGGEIITYDKPAKSDFARRMREQGTVTFNHYASKLAPQNVERMKYVKPGGSWRDIPHELLPKGMQRARKTDHTKRYGRLRNDGLAGTVLTKCDPHWGAVFLPDQDRALTVREAARIQSFPDAYKFLGNRVSQYEQVGNAVPVLMASAIAQSILVALQGMKSTLRSRNVA
jgi:DNA (cytosine-5)-methyltransferase 1